jgi:argininosuccinate lyase
MDGSNARPHEDKAAGSGYSTATDLADWLVRELGIPFREAHHVTGRAVAHGREPQRGNLEDLSLEELQAINPAITDAVFSVLTVDASVRSRKQLTAAPHPTASARRWLTGAAGFDRRAKRGCTLHRKRL